MPLLKHFGIDPLFFGDFCRREPSAAFLSPPVAMSAFYLKGVSPPHVTLNQIFAGMMPYMLIVIICMIIMYIWPGNGALASELSLWQLSNETLIRYGKVLPSPLRGNHGPVAGSLLRVMTRNR